MTTSRLLVRSPNWLGDLVMALPALGAIRAQHDGVLALALPSGLAPFAAAIGGIDEVVPLEAGGRLRGTAARTDRARIAARHFDRAILLTNSFATAWGLWRAGIPRRAGYAVQWRRLLLTEPVSVRAARVTDADRSMHHSRYYMRLAVALGGTPTSPPLPLRVDASAVAAMRATLASAAGGRRSERPVVVVAPGAAFGHAKRYPPDLLAALIDDVATRTPVTVVLDGAPGDRAAAAEVESALAARAPRGLDLVNLTGQTSLSDLLALVSIARVVVANDSGAMHVASALSKPVVVPFGPTDEVATGPLGPHAVMTADVACRPCHLRECPIDHRCMRRIDPGALAARVVDFLLGEVAR